MEAPAFAASSPEEEPAEELGGLGFATESGVVAWAQEEQEQRMREAEVGCGTGRGAEA